MIEKLRIRFTQAFAVLFMVVISVSGSYWEESFVSAVLFFIGIILASIGSMGRLWCSLYIAGYKTDKLITEGPYSACRNPLYLFSFIGAIGISFATETFLIPIIVVFAFAIYYPSVIKSEEAELKKLHKNEFEMYYSKVPSFFPRLSYLKEPEEYIVKPVIFRRHILDAIWFIWFIGILELIEKLHEIEIIPVIFKLY